MSIFKQNLIYFIQGTHTKKIKIGRTQTTIEERISTLQCGSPDELVFIGGLLGSKQDESKLHKKFKKHRLYGEWFNPDTEIIDFVSKNCLFSTDALFYVDSEIYQNKTTFKEALKLGIDILEQKDKEKMSDMLLNCLSRI